MSKKIIAILTIATILFVCVFAACDKNDSESKESLYVTDENGDRVLGEDGQFLVYETNADGEIVTDESGEKVTEAQMFEPVMENGVLEDYGFKLTIPEGWKQSKDENNIFVNKDKTVEIRLVERVYDEYLEKSRQLYDALFDKGVKGSIEEDADFVKGAEKAFRLKVEIEEDEYITTVFLNNGNLYNVTLKAPKGKIDVADAEAFLNAFEFKPYTYYPELTAESTEEGAEESTEENITEDTTK